jgi:hypothetical protein
VARKRDHRSPIPSDDDEEAVEIIAGKRESINWLTPVKLLCMRWSCRVPRLSKARQQGCH